MKAAVYSEPGGPEVIRIADLPSPVAGPGEVRVRVRAASVNHLDLWVRRGLAGQPSMPHVGGADAAGEVESLGDGVDPEWRGARVVVDPALDYDWYERGVRAPGVRRFRLLGEHVAGAFAELCVVPAANLVRLPPDVSFETAAAAGLVTVTAWRAIVTRAVLRAGETVLITGASGGVSTMAVQIARGLGARVLALTRGPERARRVRALGAHGVYDRDAGDWARELWTETGRRGVDVALDSVGQALWPALVRSLAVRGRLVSYGATTGGEAATDLRQVFWKQLSILGTTMGDPGEYRTAMEQVFAGTLRPVIHDVLPLERLREAHELLESGRVFGKLVVVP